MWLESSHVNIVNSAKKCTTIPEMSHFFVGDYFLWHVLYIIIIIIISQQDVLQETKFVLPASMTSEAGTSSDHATSYQEQYSEQTPPPVAMQPVLAPSASNSGVAVQASTEPTHGSTVVEQLPPRVLQVLRQSELLT